MFTLRYARNFVLKYSVTALRQVRKVSVVLMSVPLWKLCEHSKVNQGCKRPTSGRTTSP
jgi:hypothetical protein